MEFDNFGLTINPPKIYVTVYRDHDRGVDVGGIPVWAVNIENADEALEQAIEEMQVHPNTRIIGVLHDSGVIETEW